MTNRSLPQPPSPASTFGGRVRERRRQLDLTQAHVALVVGRSQVWVSHIESNRHSPTIADLAALATLLETTTDYLVFGQETLRGP